MAGARWVVVMIAMVAQVAGAEAQPRAGCRSPPAEPSFRPPDWADERTGVPAPDEAAARARVQRLQIALRAARADGAAQSGEIQRRLAEAYRDVYRATGDPSARQRAIRAFARTIRDAPESSKIDLVLFRLGSLLAGMGQHANARVVFHRLVRGYPASIYVAPAYVALGDQHWREGDLRAARECYARAAQMNRGVVSAYARYMEAWCHHQLSHPQRARTAVNLARALLTGRTRPTALALARALDRDACTLAP